MLPWRQIAGELRDTGRRTILGNSDGIRYVRPVPLRKTPEEKAQRDAIRAQQQREAEQRRLSQARQELRDDFFKTPAGQARLAFERGDQVFQYALNVMSQKAIIVAMVGSNVAQKTADPSVILNSVCAEGWELVNGSFVFVETGQQSRDKFMSSGQNVAVSGATVGYYLFKRCEANRASQLAEPWTQTDSGVGIQEVPVTTTAPLAKVWANKSDADSGSGD